MKVDLDPGKFYVIGNNLALDFINTAGNDLTLENLLSWAVAVNLVKASEAQDFAERWDGKDLGEIASFRKRLREAVISVVNKKKLPRAEIQWINTILRESGAYSELGESDAGFIKNIKIDIGKPDKIRIPITESFVDLICYSDPELLRKCEREECILYFYDTTKNHRRRWCSMAICGNRAKAAKFYHKKKSES